MLISFDRFSFLRRNSKRRQATRRTNTRTAGTRHVEQLEDRCLLTGFDFQQKIYAASLNPNSEEVGTSVDLDGDFAVIGAPDAMVINGTSVFTSGAAYVYQRHDAGTPGDSTDDFWLYQTQLIPTDLPSLNFDRFGFAVGISGDTIVVGTPHDDGVATTSSGAAYVFDRNAGGPDSWGQVAKLTDQFASDSDQLGSAVAIDGDTVVVGSPSDGNFGSNSGSAFVFDRNQGGSDAWGEVQVLNASDAAANDHFGSTVAVSGDTIIIGADQDDDSFSNSGSAYLFDRDFGGINNWGERTKIVSVSPGSNDRFGWSVAIDSDTVIVGEILGGPSGSGAVEIFGRDQGGTDNWGRIIELTTPDGTSYFGSAVDISGSRIVVGAQFENSMGNGAGAAYIFDKDTGGTDNWGQVKRILPADVSEGDQFGAAVALSGSQLFVGSPRDDDGGSFNTDFDSGSAYLFEQNLQGVDNWGQQQKLTFSNPQANDNTGQSVSIDGDRMVISAPGRLESPDFAGAVYLYERDDSGTPTDLTDDVWLYSHTLTASDADDGDLFGASVSIKGDLIVVGAPGNDDAGSDSGSAYLFEQSFGGFNNWGERKKLTAAVPAAGDRFGESVSVDSDTLVVGATLGDSGVADSGAAYVFGQNQGGGNNWGQVKLLVASNAAAGDAFGQSIGVAGDSIIVGSPLGDNGVADIGAAYVFDRDSGGTDNWGEVKLLNSSDAAAGDGFGSAVFIDGDSAAVGAPQNDNGAAYIFDRDNGGAGNWGETTKITAADGAAGDEFGSAVALSGDSLLVAAHLDDNSTDTGSAYLFGRDEGGVNNWGQLSKVVALDAADNDEFGTSVAIDGNLAVIGSPLDDDGGSAAGSAYAFSIRRDIEVSVAPASVTEDGVLNLEFTFTRTGATDHALITNFSVGGTAVFEDDYEASGATSFEAAAGSVTFPVGVASVVVLVDPTPDANIEPDETVDLTLTASSLYDIGAMASDSGSITNDDEVEIVVSPADVAEDGIPDAVFTFNRADTSGALTVNFTIAATAELGIDYSQSGAATFDPIVGTGSIDFADTVGSVTLTLDPMMDPLVELDESVTLTLAAGAGYTVSIPEPETATIINDDMATLSVTDVTMVETDANTIFTFDVTLTGTVDTDVNVKASTGNDTARFGEDFNAVVSQSVIFPASTTTPQTMSVDVTVTGDTVVELNESFFLAVTSIDANGRNVVFDTGQVLNHVAQLTPFESFSQSLSGSGVISSDSSRVVYLADQDTNNVNELYSVLLLGGPATKLNSPLPGNSGIQNFLLSPDGTRVVYRGSQETVGVNELFSVPIDGGAPPVKLNATLPAGGDVSFQTNDVLITPDGTHVIYIAEQDTDGVYELYSVPIDGSAPPTKLSGPIVAGGLIQFNRIQVSSDSSRVLYMASHDSATDTELYSVPVDGSAAPTKLNGALVTNGDVNRFVISADSSTAVYVADQLTDARNELFSVPIAGGAFTKLSEPITNGFNFINPQINADSSEVVYVANYHGAATSSRFELFSVPIGGGAVRHLSTDGVSTQSVNNSVRIASDGQTALYTRRDDFSNERLFSTPIDASAPPAAINGPAATGTSNSVDFRISPDGATVVYTFAQDNNFQDELYAVPIGGGAAIKLNGPLVSTSGSLDVLDFEIRPDGNSVVYRSYQDSTSFAELYSVPILGGPNTKVSDPTLTSTPGSNYVISPDSRAVVFTQNNSPLQLFSSLEAVRGTGIITNDDSATITVTNPQVSEALGTVTFTATLSGDVDVPFTVDFETIDGTATDGVDYSGVDSMQFGGFFFFGNDGDSDSQSVTIATDNIVELNETLLFDLLSQNSGRSGITLVDGTGTILNDDTATLQVTGGSITEGQSGTSTLDFEVKLLGFIQGGLAVPFSTMDGSATIADGDYSANSGTLNFAGTSFVDIQTVSVDVTGDNVVELYESFLLDLGTLTAAQADTNAIVLIGDPAIGTIINDDMASISIADASQAEGDSGGTLFEFITTLSQPVDTDLQLTFGTADGTATLADSDYQTISGVTSFASGDLTGVVKVLVNGNTLIEPDEIFGVVLETISAGDRSVTFADPSAVGTILNDDTATLTLDDVDVDEDTGTVDVTVTLDVLVPDGFTVDYSLGGGTADASDYTTTGGTLTFSGTAGESQVISIPISVDPDVEFDETFTVSLNNVQPVDPQINASAVIAIDTADVTILNDDTVLVVDTNANGGAGSLRKAIADSNAFPGAQTIAFAIPGAGPHIITLNSSLPSIQDAVVVDGTTQAGYSGTPLIEVNGENLVAGSGLRIVAGGAGSTIRGLAINRMAYHGIVLLSDGNTIESSHIGTDASGTVDFGNGKNGILVVGASGNMIGGTTSGSGNLISGNGLHGVLLGNSATANMIQGNRIGSDVTGTLPIANDMRGIQFSNASGNTIGGSVAGAGNLISGNASHGVLVNATSDNNVFEGNLIGTQADGVSALGNGIHGLRIQGSNNVVGGTVAGAGNVVAFNTRGVFVTGIGNAIRGNSIFDNSGPGIHLAAGANNDQNAPVLTSAALSGSTIDITFEVPGFVGSLDVEFFIADSSNKEGQTFLATVVYGAAGSVTVSIPAGAAAAGSHLVATATDAAGNTSNFSGSVVVANAFAFSSSASSFSSSASSLIFQPIAGLDDLFMDEADVALQVF